MIVHVTCVCQYELFVFNQLFVVEQKCNPDDAGVFVGARNVACEEDLEPVRLVGTKIGVEYSSALRGPSVPGVRLEEAYR